jgi:hypothetical protein
MSRLLGPIVIACLLIAAAEAVVAAFAVAVTLLVLWGLIAHPESTIPLLLFFLLLEALGRWPLATAGSLIALAGAFWIASHTKRSRAGAQPPIALLPPPDAPADGE